MIGAPGGCTVQNVAQHASNEGDTVGERPQRVALYGGSFDPVHEAHLAIAREAVATVGLDRLFFIPSARSPLKGRAPVAGDRERLEMLRLAVRDHPVFRTSAYELREGGASYSLKTVRFFGGRFPGARLFWILGADQFEQLPRWHKIDSLVRQVEFLVFQRPGVEGRPPRLPGLCYRLIEGILREDSSSEIRRRREAGHPISGLVPKSVETFVLKHNLYADSADDSYA